MVGTLWEDHYATGDAGSCWHAGSFNLGGNGRGWKEIHPVDYMARLGGSNFGRNIDSDKLLSMTMCGAGQAVKSVMLGPPPSDGAYALGCEEILNTEWTVRPADIASDVVTRLPNGSGVQVSVQLNSRGPFGGDPKFYAGYHVFWKPVPFKTGGGQEFQCPQVKVPQ
jgi:hypothetical protein